MKAALYITFLAAFGIFSVFVKNELRRNRSPLESLQIGQAMPDFTLADQNGSDVTFSRIATGKKLTVVNFWASWCAPCRLEMPNFDKLYKTRSKDGLLILAIDEDEETAKMDAYLKEKPLSFPILMDKDGALMKRWGGRAFPTTIVVGADGKIQAVDEGVQQYLQYMVDDALRPQSKRQ
jgi:peroxiredoxin